MSDKRHKNNYYTENRELIISVQESERQRIARDLHDATLQNLTHMVHQLELCELYMEKDIIKARLELLSTRKNLHIVIEEIRNIIFDLHPMTFDDLGLKETYENFFDTLKEYTSFEFDVIIDDIKDEYDYFLLSIYRIGRECVMNSIRHSKGRRILFRCIREENYIKLVIEDDGIGYSYEDIMEKNNHYGLTSVNERVKLLKGIIERKFDNGTKILIKIPSDYRCN